MSVTAEDVRLGLIADRRLCPVARAVGRAIGRDFPGWQVSIARAPWLTQWHAHLTAPDASRLVLYRFNRRVAEQVAAYDRREEMTPFRFTLWGATEFGPSRSPDRPA